PGCRWIFEGVPAGLGAGHQMHESHALRIGAFALMVACWPAPNDPPTREPSTAKPSFVAPNSPPHTIPSTFWSPSTWSPPSTFGRLRPWSPPSPPSTFWSSSTWSPPSTFGRLGWLILVARLLTQPRALDLHTRRPPAKLRPARLRIGRTSAKFQPACL